MNLTDSAAQSGVAHAVAESLKLVDVITIASACGSLMIVLLTLLIIVYFFIRAREDVRQMDAVKEKLGILEQKRNEGDYISDQTTNVLYDLYRLIAGVKSYIELASLGYQAHDQLFEKMEEDVVAIEKHFSELGLLSVDKERRVSAQQNLANLSGNLDTLRIMQQISRREIGIFDPEILVSIRQLKRRLGRNVIDSGAWTGRPSGGAF
jgi:hypothetical protein